jgi:hypothetical protein
MANYLFTEEQLEAAKTAKSPEELAARAKEQGYDIPPEQAEALFEQSAKLSDEQLAGVAGGGITSRRVSSPTNADEKAKAAADGRVVYADGIVDGSCNHTSVYAREKWVIKHGFDEYRDSKCYHCGRNLGNINTLGFKVK